VGGGRGMLEDACRKEKGRGKKGGRKNLLEPERGNRSKVSLQRNLKKEGEGRKKKGTNLVGLREAKKRRNVLGGRASSLSKGGKGG